MTTSNKSTLIATFATLLGLAMVTLPSTASAYNAATDFSSVSNPNGAWSYGWAPSVGSGFTLDTTNTQSYFGSGLSGWLGDQIVSDGTPYILFNGTAGPLAASGTTTYQPGQLAESPGTNGLYAVVRWTAPSSGLYNIATTFSGLSTLGASVDVHILNNGSSIFDSTVNPNPTSYSGIQSINAGQSIDFVVGCLNGDKNEDTTLLQATIQAVPEPGTMGLVAMAFGCLFPFGYLKRK